MRHSLLDICGSSDDGTPQPATMLGMEIETLNRLRWSQHNTQLQLCVPLVAITSAWWTRRSIMAAVISTLIFEYCC
jgi:hypothetical protein